MNWYVEAYDQFAVLRHNILISNNRKTDKMHTYQHYDANSIRFTKSRSKRKCLSLSSI